jgi:AraC family transcriptional regulator
MNFYVRMMNDVIDQIEENVSEPITLQTLSREFCFSEYHFSRLFKALTGFTLKQYILGRKLTLAGERLRNTAVPVTDIAYDFGFAYPEVFSRTFKKHYGVSPSLYRKGGQPLPVILKANVAERDLINYRGALTLKETDVYLEPFCLRGNGLEVDERDADFEQALRTAGETFAAEWQKRSPPSEHFYSVVNCHGDDSGKYTVFFGEPVSSDTEEDGPKRRAVPGGWYAQFQYRGDLLQLRTHFVDDLYRWMIIKEVLPISNGVGMIDIFSRKDPEEILILVPIKKSE